MNKSKFGVKNALFSTKINNLENYMKYLIKALIAIAVTALSVPSFAVPIASVGMVDSLIAQRTLSNSGTGTEKAWVQTILGQSATYTQFSSNNSNSANWLQVTNSSGNIPGGYAFNFGVANNPTHYLVKVGGGGGTGTSNTHFLFSNLASLQWAFVNLRQFGSNVKLTNIGIISHVGITGNTVPVPVPAPAPLAIMVIGLIGMVGLSRIKEIG